MPWTPGVPQWWTMRINWNRTSIDTIRFSSGHTRTVTTQTTLTKDKMAFPGAPSRGVGWRLERWRIGGRRRIALRGKLDDVGHYLTSPLWHVQWCWEVRARTLM
jgi:hypothetical protein